MTDEIVKHGPFEFSLLPSEGDLRVGTLRGYTPQFILGSDPEKGLHGKLGERFFHGLTHPELMGLLTKSPGEFPTMYKNPYGLMGAISRLKATPEEAKVAAIKEALVFSGLARRLTPIAQKATQFFQRTPSVPAQAPAQIPRISTQAAVGLGTAPTQIAPTMGRSVGKVPYHSPLGEYAQSLIDNPPQQQRVQPLTRAQSATTRLREMMPQATPQGEKARRAVWSARDQFAQMAPTLQPEQIQQHVATNPRLRASLISRLRGAADSPSMTSGIHSALQAHGIPVPPQGFGSLPEAIRHLQSSTGLQMDPGMA